MVEPLQVLQRLQDAVGNTPVAELVVVGAYGGEQGFGVVVRDKPVRTVNKGDLETLDHGEDELIFLIEVSPRRVLDAHPVRQIDEYEPAAPFRHGPLGGLQDSLQELNGLRVVQFRFVR